MIVIMRKQLTTAVLLAISFTSEGVAAPPVVPAERFDWMPVEGIGAKLAADDLGGEQILPEITLTPTPKPTADLAKFTKVYTIDLQKFGIYNDGTHADETSAGLNRALQDAKAAGANHIVFPAGTYQISETAPLVVDLRDAVIDFNGATLVIRPNGLPKYAVVEIIDGAENVRLTNGTLLGDRDAHNFKAEPGTHEWGQGIRFIGGRNLEVDHMTLRDMTGDGASSTTSGARTRPELLAAIKHSLFAKEFEAGALNDRGEPVPGPKMRSIKPYDVAKCGGEFELGYYGGYMGYPFIKGRVYQAYFFDAELRLLEHRKCLQYRKTAVPAGAKWLHLEFNQPEIPEEPAHVGAAKGSWFARITNLRPSVDVHFHHNTLIHNRRLGMAFCGGQRWLLEDNLFAENRGTNPAYGIDFEDGAELVQDVVFRRNKFRDNGNGDLVVCAGSELIFEDNEFEKSVVTWGRAHHYVFRRNHYRGGSVSYTTRTGVADIHDNRYENCKLAIRFDTKGVADGLVRKAGQKVATPPLQLRNETLVDVSRVEGTYFDLLDCKLRGTHFTAGPETRLVRVRGGEATDSSIEYEAVGPTVSVKLENVAGQVTEQGPGLKRKQPLP
jgi:hypothetical protein